eukprot:jgi/Bigna1/141479/aug1.63_g16187
MEPLLRNQKEGGGAGRSGNYKLDRRRIIIVQSVSSVFFLVVLLLLSAAVLVSQRPTTNNSYFPSVYAQEEHNRRQYDDAINTGGLLGSGLLTHGDNPKHEDGRGTSNATSTSNLTSSSDLGSNQERGEKEGVSSIPTRIQRIKNWFICRSKVIRRFMTKEEEKEKKDEDHESNRNGVIFRDVKVEDKNKDDKQDEQDDHRNKNNNNSDNIHEKETKEEITLDDELEEEEEEEDMGWAPYASGRFLQLANTGFYAGNKFFKVEENFVAHFGINGDPTVSEAWGMRPLPEDPVKESNKRGYLSFAPDSRARLGTMTTTEVFINLVDNTHLDDEGFAPFARIVSGNRYLEENYPQLSFIIGTRVERDLTPPPPASDS